MSMNFGFGTAIVKCHVDQRVSLGGFASIRDNIGSEQRVVEANIFAYCGHLSVPVVVISIDAVYVNDLSRQLEHMRKDEGVIILVCATHTHFVPGLMSEYKGLGNTDASYLADITASVHRSIRSALCVAHNNQLGYTMELGAECSWTAIVRRRSGLRFIKKLPFFVAGMIGAPSGSEPGSYPVSRS